MQNEQISPQLSLRDGDSLFTRHYSQTIGLIILLVLTIFALGFYIYFQKQVERVASESDATVFTSGPYTGWNAYTNSEYSFSFKYPKSFSLVSNEGGKLLFESSDKTVGDYTIPNGPYSHAVNENGKSIPAVFKDVLINGMQLEVDIQKITNKEDAVQSAINKYRLAGDMTGQRFTKNGIDIYTTSAYFESVYGGTIVYCTTDTLQVSFKTTYNEYVTKDTQSFKMANLIADSFALIQTQNKTQQTALTQNMLQNETFSYSLPNIDSNLVGNQSDTFTLHDGKATLGTGTANSRTYSYITSAVGDINGDGLQDGVVAMYKTWGANRITPMVFVLLGQASGLKSVAVGLPDTSAWLDKTQISKIEILPDGLDVHIVTLSSADQTKPSYLQQASVYKIVSFSLLNNSLTLVNSNEETSAISNENDGRYLGYIKNISRQQLTIDYTQWLTCETGDSNCIDNVAKVVNENDKLRVLALDPNVVVTLQTYSHQTSGPNAGNYNFNQIVSIDTFISAFNNSTSVYPAQSRLYWVQVHNNKIVLITEQYQP